MEVQYSCYRRVRRDRKGFSIGLHQIPKQWLESQIPLYLCLNLELPDFLCQRFNTPLVLLRYLADFLHGVVDLYGT